MAPSRQNKAPPYAKDEKVLCFHGDLMYEAKINQVSLKAGQKPEDAQYHVHYTGWKASWDDWVSQDRMRKYTEENKQLATQLAAQARARTQGAKGGKKGARANGSEMSSARGSEERVAGSSSFGGRGPRRGRDYELESVSTFVLYFSFFFLVFSFLFPLGHTPVSRGALRCLEVPKPQISWLYLPICPGRATHPHPLFSQPLPFALHFSRGLCTLHNLFQPFWFCFPVVAYETQDYS